MKTNWVLMVAGVVAAFVAAAHGQTVTEEDAVKVVDMYHHTKTYGPGDYMVVMDIEVENGPTSPTVYSGKSKAILLVEKHMRYMRAESAGGIDVLPDFDNLKEVQAHPPHIPFLFGEYEVVWMHGNMFDLRAPEGVAGPMIRPTAHIHMAKFGELPDPLLWPTARQSLFEASDNYLLGKCELDLIRKGESRLLKGAYEKGILKTAWSRDWDHIPKYDATAQQRTILHFDANDQVVYYASYEEVTRKGKLARSTPQHEFWTEWTEYDGISVPSKVTFVLKSCEGDMRFRLSAVHPTVVTAKMTWVPKEDETYQALREMLKDFDSKFGPISKRTSAEMARAEQHAKDNPPTEEEKEKQKKEIEKQLKEHGISRPKPLVPFPPTTEPPEKQ